jgi:hypothetical protein
MFVIYSLSVEPSTVFYQMCCKRYLFPYGFTNVVDYCLSCDSCIYCKNRNSNICLDEYIANLCLFVDDRNIKLVDIRLYVTENIFELYYNLRK